MRYLFISIFLTIYIVAKGTISGLVIKNSATISFEINGQKFSTKSNSDSFVVDKIVDVKVTWEDNSVVHIASNEKNRVLTFNVSNLGNSKDKIKLNYIVDINRSFKPLPSNIRLIEDSNHNGVFDSKDKKIDYISLDADKNQTLFIVSDFKDANYTLNSNAYVGIEATSTSKNTKGVDSKDKIDTVVRRGSSSGFGIYKVRDCWLEATQSSEVLSDDNKTHTGSIVKYKISLSIGGNANGKLIKDINITDVIPPQSLYIPNSLKLNGKKLSDSKYIKDGNITISELSISNKNKKIVEFKVQIK